MDSYKKIATLKETIKLDEEKEQFQETEVTNPRRRENTAIGVPYWKDNVLNMLNLRPQGRPKGGQGNVAC